MKTLKESLFSKKNIENSKINKYGISKKDMKGDIEGFPIGIVVRMMELQESQGNKPDIEVFQNNRLSGRKGFSWGGTYEGFVFWNRVINNKNFNFFFERYPEYEKYN